MRRDKKFAAPYTSWLPDIGIEAVSCVGLLAYFAVQGAIPGIAPNQANEMTNSAATGLMKVGGIGSQLMANGVICALVLSHLRRLRRFAFALQWTAAIAVFAICSTFWSQDAVMSARRSLAFALATLFGLYLASRFQVRQQLRILIVTMVLLAAASVILALAFPSIGLEASTGHSGNWQGAFTQKNACGRAMVFATAALLSLRGAYLWRFICLLLFTFVLVMSGSRGAWLIEGILLVGFGLLRIAERSAPITRLLLLCGSIAAVVTAMVSAWIYFPLIAGFLGRDPTLSGRTAIWKQVWIAASKHPLLGYGLAAFWQGMKGESYNVILALRFVIFHAHNGLLEIWLELGAVGLSLFVLSYLRAWRKLWPILGSARMGQAFWMIFVLLLVALYDVDENTLLTFNGLFWILYVVAVANIEIMRREHRLKHRGINCQVNEADQVAVQAAV